MLRATAMILLVCVCGDAGARVAIGGDGYGGILRGQPMQQLARASGSGGIELIECVVKPVYKEVTYQYQVDVPFVSPDGAQSTRPETRTATRRVCEFVTMEIVHQADSQTRYFEVDGSPVDPRTAARRLQEPVLVLVSPNDKVVPAYYTHLFKTGTLVVTSPRTYASMPATPIDASASGQSQPTRQVYQNTGLPPNIRFASLSGKGTIRLRDFSEHSTREITSKALPASSDRPREITTITVGRISRINDTLEYNLADVEVFMANGTPIGNDGLAAMLSRETAVLVSADSQHVDPFWLSNLKPTMLVVVAPMVNSAGRVQPMPAMSFPAPAMAPPPPGAAPAPVLKDANAAEKPQA